MLTSKNAHGDFDRRRCHRHLCVGSWHAGSNADSPINQSRWYDPSVGRWLSEDPSGLQSGDANLYRYCGNGPTDGMDPSGLAVNLSDGKYLDDRRQYGNSHFDGEGVLCVCASRCSRKLSSSTRGVTWRRRPSGRNSSRQWKARSTARPSVFTRHAGSHR